MLYGYALTRLREPTQAEDVVQETLLAGIRHIRQFNGKGSQRAWLLGILKRKVLDQVRRRQRQSQYLVQAEFDPAALMFDVDGKWHQGLMPEISPSDSAEAGEIWQIVRDCLTLLPAAQADAFVLSAMEQMEPQRICEELGITLKNLWVRLHRARLGLAKCVSAKWLLDSDS